MITSSDNQKLKEIRKLNARRRDRDRFQRFVAEGEDLLEAADQAGWEPVARLSVEGSGLPGEPILPELLAQVSELGSGSRTIAIYEQRWSEPAGPLAVYLHGVHDPGNVGTIIRSAHAFGASCIVFGPGSADPYSPKAVRASMGSIFAVPLARVADMRELIGQSVALAADGEVTFEELDLPAEVTLMVGAEREGLPDELMRLADHAVQIPTRIHSLNAAMAATIALYELSRRMPSA